MNAGKALVGIVATVLISGVVWLMVREPVESVLDSAEEVPPTQLSALPDAEVSRLRVVRKGIANGEADRDFEFRDRIERVAALLSDEELIAALELVSEPNYLIETLCFDEAVPLERKIALLSHFVEIQDSEGMDDSLVAAAYEFAKIDPAATREWLRIFEPGVGSGQAYGIIFDQLDKTDPAASVAMFCDLDDREAEAIIGYGNGPDLKHLSGREFLALVGTLRSDHLREFQLRQTVVWHLAEDDPEDALAYIRALPAEEREATHGRHLVQIWARADEADFPAIIDRMNSDLPEEVRSPETYYVLAEAWYQRSPDEVLAWIGKLDAGGARDAAVSGFLRESNRSDLSGSFALARTMSDAAEREEASVRILSVWIDSDTAAVRALLPDVELSDRVRADLERKLKYVSERE